MKLTPPTQAVFLISAVLAILALLVTTGSLSLSISAFWLMAVAYVLLALGNLMKGL